VSWGNIEIYASRGTTEQCMPGRYEQGCCCCCYHGDAKCRYNCSTSTSIIAMNHEIAVGVASDNCTPIFCYNLLRLRHIRRPTHHRRNQGVTAGDTPEEPKISGHKCVQNAFAVPPPREIPGYAYATQSMSYLHKMIGDSNIRHNMLHCSGVAIFCCSECARR